MPKPKPATLEERRLYPDADPTAPGGMSLSELRVELAEYHSTPMDMSREMTWPELIEATVEGRLAREAEHGRGTSKSDWGKPVPEKSVAAEEYDAAMEGLCQHGEDPDLCEACEAVLLGDDYLEYEPSDPDPEGLTERDRYAVSEKPVIELPAGGTDWADVSQRPTGDDLDDLEREFAEAATERDNDAVSQPTSLFIGMPGVLDYSFSGHSGVGPSQAERWMNCTASLGASRRFLERLSSNQQYEFAGASGTAARQGTTAHAAAEVEARVMIGEMDSIEAENLLLDLAIDPPAGEDYTPEMAQFITEYTDLIKQYVDAGHEVLIEARVAAAVPLQAPLTLETLAYLGMDLPDPDSDESDDDYYVIPGSVDCGVMPTDEDPVLTAIDLKYGEGKDVEVESNPQVRIYMLGLLAQFVEAGGDIDALDRLDYVIAQPRLGGIKVWTESVDDLLDWRDNVLSPALTAALGLAPAVYSPGEETCEWCPARGGCAALAGARVESATELFTALDEAEFGDGPGVVASDLDDDRLASLLSQITGLVDLAKDLKAEAQRRLYRGDKIPGFVLVNYTPPRHWKGDATEKLEEVREVWKEPTLMTPTQALKVLGKEGPAVLEDLIEVPDRRPVVAAEGDRRSLWQGIPPEQMFPDLGDDE